MAAEFDKAMLEALRLTRPPFIEGIKMKDGMTRSFDNMLKIGFKDPDEAEKHMRWIGDVVRSSLQSLVFWSTADHVPAVCDGAQRVLADVVRVLCDWRYVKLTRPVGGKSDAFAQRWRTTTKRGRGKSNYAAVAGFAILLVAEVEIVIGKIVESYLEITKDAPRHVTFVMPLVKAIFESEPLARELPTYVISSVTWFLFQPELFEQSWKKFFWPIGKEMWPAFAREFETWTGPNGTKTGAPLSHRKRVVDGKTDFSPSRFEDEIKRAFEGLVLHRRAAAGD